jgi:hypothetical protein
MLLQATACRLALMMGVNTMDSELLVKDSLAQDEPPYIRVSPSFYRPLPEDPVEREERAFFERRRRDLDFEPDRRTMWSLYILDQARVTCSAWWSCLTEENLMLALPSLEEDYQSSNLPANPPDHYSPWRHLEGYAKHDLFESGPFSWLCRIMDLLGQILRKIFRRGNVKNGADLRDRSSFTSADIIAFDSAYVKLVDLCWELTFGLPDCCGSKLGWTEKPQNLQKLLSSPRSIGTRLLSVSSAFQEVLPSLTRVAVCHFATTMLHYPFYPAQDPALPSNRYSAQRTAESTQNILQFASTISSCNSTLSSPSSPLNFYTAFPPYVVDVFSLYSVGLKDGNNHPTAAWRKRFCTVMQAYHYPTPPDPTLQHEESLYFDTECDRQVCRYTTDVRLALVALRKLTLKQRMRQRWLTDSRFGTAMLTRDESG